MGAVGQGDNHRKVAARMRLLQRGRKVERPRVGHPAALHHGDHMRRARELLASHAHAHPAMGDIHLSKDVGCGPHVLLRSANRLAAAQSSLILSPMLGDGRRARGRWCACLKWLARGGTSVQDQVQADISSAYRPCR